jgi:hypothetical protein
MRRAGATSCVSGAAWTSTPTGTDACNGQDDEMARRRADGDELRRWVRAARPGPPPASRAWWWTPATRALLLARRLRRIDNDWRLDAYADGDELRCAARRGRRAASRARLTPVSRDDATCNGQATTAMATCRSCGRAARLPPPASRALWLVRSRGREDSTGLDNDCNGGRGLPSSATSCGVGALRRGGDSCVSGAVDSAKLPAGTDATCDDDDCVARRGVLPDATTRGDDSCVARAHWARATAWTTAPRPYGRRAAAWASADGLDKLRQARTPAWLDWMAPESVRAVPPPAACWRGGGLLRGRHGADADCDGGSTTTATPRRMRPTCRIRSVNRVPDGGSPSA